MSFLVGWFISSNSILETIKYMRDLNDSTKMNFADSDSHIKQYNLVLCEPAILQKKFEGLFRDEKVDRESNVSVFCASGFERESTKYHALKMDELNALIDELWKKAHGGSAENTIVIRYKIQSASNFWDIRSRGDYKTYEYRVYMAMPGLERDMLGLKGYFSPSQIELASLVIRMSIGQVFDTTYGVLPVVEPAGDLDDKHTEALVKAIWLVTAKKPQGSQIHYQIVITTLDKRFWAQMITFARGHIELFVHGS